VGKYLVSTVGLFVHPSKAGSNERTEAEFLDKNPNGEEIGHQRFYETMVFRAGLPCQEKGCDCGLPTIDGHELDVEYYQEAGPANKGHMRMCQKWSKND
jgi:hypothetical protein